MAEIETTLEAAAYTQQGTPRERVSLPAAVFDGTVNMPVMHQAVKAYLANQRQGNAATKTRRWVTGGNQKPWKQKGTGRARQGSIRAPHWVGGGTVFGPTPRAYDQYVPRQVRALARRSAFNARARENAIFVIDAFEFDAPKTARMLALFDRLGLADQKVLILTDGAKPNVFLSARNIGYAHVMPYSDVSTYHLLWSDVVLIESSALGQALAPIAEAPWSPPARADGGARSAEPKGRKAAKKSAKVEAAPAPRAGRPKAAPKKAAKQAKASSTRAAKKKTSTARKKAAAPKKKRGK